MYTLSRILLSLSVLIALYCLALLAALMWPGSGWIIGLIAAGYVVQRRRAPLTTLGSARFAEEKDLRRALVLGADKGLILGRLPYGAKRNSRLRQLFSRQVSAKDACAAILSRSARGRSELVRLPQAIHTVAFAPSGGGKGVSLIIPHLKTCAENMVIIDFKGELAAKTALHRQRTFGHRIVRLDPYRVTTQTPDTLNCLDLVDGSSPFAIDECNDFAKALVARTGDEKEPHWNDSAELVIAAVMATVSRFGDPSETRSLQIVADVIAHPQLLGEAIKKMCESDCWDGNLARMGGQLLHFEGKEKSGVLTTAMRHLRFLGTPAIAASTSSSSFSPAELRSGRMTAYCILPPEHMRAQSGLLRLWVATLMRAVIKGGLQE